MNNDWRVYEGSRMSRLPRPLQPLALLARNLFGPKDLRPHHSSDGVTTLANMGFRETPEFRNAYARGLKAAGWDYVIPYRLHQALWCAHQAGKVQGDFVELGTGRGFVMSGVLSAYPRWAEEGRGLHLFDTFLPAALDAQGKQSKDGKASPYYAVSLEEVEQNFREWPNVHLHQGDVFETLPVNLPSAVALLHIDFNYAPPEIFGLKTLWPLIPRGGVILLDDYASPGHENQYRAMNEAAVELGFRILSTPTGQGIIIK